MSWATTGAPDTPRGSGTAVAFRRRETASHPHGLSITLDSGATTELCVDSEPEVVALRRALLKAGVPEGDEGEEDEAAAATGTKLLPASAPRSDE